MSRTLLICRTLHQDKYSFQVFASWVLNVSSIEILQTCYKQSLHSIWVTFTTYLNSYLQIWRPVHFWRPAMVLRYTYCFDPYCIRVTSRPRRFPPYFLMTLLLYFLLIYTYPSAPNRVFLLYLPGFIVIFILLSSNNNNRPVAKKWSRISDFDYYQKSYIWNDKNAFWYKVQLYIYIYQKVSSSSFW